MQHAQRLHRMFGFGLTLIGMALAAAVWAAKDYGHDLGRVHHSYEVRLAISELSSNLRSAEMWHRGFLVAGVVDENERFQAALERVRLCMGRLRSLTRDNSEQQRRLANITTVTEREIVRMETAHRALGEGRYGIAAGTLDDGRRDEDALRLFLGNMAIAEQQLLEDRTERVEASLSRANSTAAITALLAVILIGWSWRKLGRIAVAQHVHIGKLAQSEANARTDSLHDELTGIYNRRGLTQAAAELRRKHPTVSLLFADLDGLKPINDQLGHEMGDQAIREAATLLRSCVRDNDVVARVGGDELVCLLVGDCVGPVLSRIEFALASLNRRPGRPFALRMSMGAAVSSEGEPLDSLLSRADAEMYGVKMHRKRAA